MEGAPKLDFDGVRQDAEALAPPPPQRNRGGRPPGPQRGKQRERLVAAGVPLDDPVRSTEGKRRKPAGVMTGPGLRDGPNMPLRNRGYDEVARHVAAGLPDLDAWVMAGYSPHSKQWIDVVRDPDFIARVAEFRAADRQPSNISLNFLQQRLLRIALSDPGHFFEPVPHTSGRYRVKDLASMPPELRACISEVSFDKNGRPLIKIHDRAKALNDLARLIAPTKVEMSGPDGGPMQLEAMLGPEAISKLSDDELVALKQIASKLVSAGPVLEAEAVDDGEEAS